MPYFTKKELILSLFFPAIMLLWGAYNFLFGLPWGRDLAEIRFGYFLFPLIGLVRLLVGGVLPIVLTLRFKIRTDGYFWMRLIVVVAVYFLNRLIERYALPFAGDVTVTDFLLHMIINVAAALLQILLFKRLDDTTKGELAVIATSDPCLWWAVHYLVTI